MPKTSKKPLVKKKTLKRIYHPFQKWEEVASNMWGTVSDRDTELQKTIAFTGDHRLYGQFMRRVVLEWPISCENALTDAHLNKKAWIGHAAVALALQVPEDITRQAWGHLTDEQQLLANGEAERAIASWAVHYEKSRGLHTKVGAPMLQGWRPRGSTGNPCPPRPSAVLQGCRDGNFTE